MWFDVAGGGEGCGGRVKTTTTSADQDRQAGTTSVHMTGDKPTHPQRETALLHIYRHSHVTILRLGDTSRKIPTFQNPRHPEGTSYAPNPRPCTLNPKTLLIYILTRPVSLNLKP